MKCRRYLYCVFGLVMAGLALYLLLTGLSPRAVEAKGLLPAQPVTIAQGPDQPLVVFPDPPQAHEPTEIRVTLVNSDTVPMARYAQFFWGEFGIGLERHPINGRIPFIVPPQTEGGVSIIWVPPDMGPYCFYAEIFDAPDAPAPIAAFQHNVFYQAHPDPGGGQFVEAFPYHLRNPLDVPADVIIYATSPSPAVGWEVGLYPPQMTLGPGEVISASVVFTYAGGVPLPADGVRLFDVHAVANNDPIGGFHKVFGPPLRLHLRPEPGFAESEISVSPYPIPPGEPAEICVEVRNVTQQPRQGFVFFRAAPFGIALPFEPIAPPVEIFIPGMGLQRPCIHWVAPDGGQFAFEVLVETPGYPMPVASQRVMDVGELLLPGTTSTLHFPVRNPFAGPMTVTLGFSQVFVEGWALTLSQDVLPSMAPGEARVVTMTVSVPADGVMPPDGSPVLDVEAFIGRDPIGGFRKIYRPPVPIHQPGDPIYAEREITIHPYPPREREPTEICAVLRNPTEQDQEMILDFNVSNFGIGLPFHTIARPMTVTVPAQGQLMTCITWVPPFGGRFGVEVGIQLAGHERIYSQRFIDVGEILLPNQPSPFEFLVGNPYAFPITVTMGAIRYLPQWEVTFDPPEFVLPPGAVQPVVMHVLPVQRPGDPEPHEGQPVIDVEAYWSGNGEHGLLGGFRKLFFPPVPIHRPEDPSFAEREINIFPYPPQAGEPTRLEFEARNPTTATQQITVTFEWGNLGIGLPFTPIQTNSFTLPPFQAGVIGVNWVPPFGGEFCVRVKVEAPFFTEPFYSARNISIVRLPEPYGTPEVFHFVIGDNGIATRPLTIALGLQPYLPNWHFTLYPDVIVLGSGQTYATAVLTITPPADPAELPVDGGPIVDVSGYVNGNLIGGIRKVWRPPVPLGQLGERSYAESEIVINPDPPVADQPATFSAQVRNNSDYTQTIGLQFGWADFGFGIPFSTTGVVPTQTVITLSPHMTTTVSAQWTPPYSGHFCVQILLTNEQTGESLHSQRNVDAIEAPENRCEPFIKDFWLQNATSLTVTVTLGSNAINLPPGWTYSVDPEEVILGPYAGITVTLVITPPCDNLAKGLIFPLAGSDANSPTKIQVEGYDQAGELVGGVEMQLLVVPPERVYLPSVMRNSPAGTNLAAPGMAAPEASRSAPGLPFGWAAILFLGGIGLYHRYFRLG